MKLVHLSTSGRLPASSYNLVNDAGEVISYTQIRHRPSCNDDLPPEAGNNIWYDISEAHRGRGHGKALMGLALAEAKRIGLERARLLVEEDNPTSRHIIESHGAIWVQELVDKKGARCHLYEVVLAPGDQALST